MTALKLLRKLRLCVLINIHNAFALSMYLIVDFYQLRFFLHWLLHYRVVKSSTLLYQFAYFRVLELLRHSEPTSWAHCQVSIHGRFIHGHNRSSICLEIGCLGCNRCILFDQSKAIIALLQYSIDSLKIFDDFVICGLLNALAGGLPHSALAMARDAIGADILG